jgi:hypothetical protein
LPESAAGAHLAHSSQVLTYMRLTSCPAGLLINFNVFRLIDGVKRLINPQVFGHSIEAVE